jgi:O-antigen/teichoic acid export membrane protein
VNALYFAVHLVIGPYVAEVAANPDKVASLSVRMVQTMAAVTVVGSAGLVFVGPFVLGLVGPTYRAEGQNLLFLAAAFIPLSSVGAIYEGFARVQRKLKLMVAVRCVSASVIVFGTLVATRIVGVDGVGWAYLAAESLSAAVLLVPVVLWLRRAKNTQVVAAAPL